MTSHIIKAAMASALAVSLVIGSSSAGYAQSSDTTVVNTGDNANVSTNTTTTTNVEVNNDNVADIQQIVNVSANTGGNTANGNIGGSSIVTGDAIVSASLSTLANRNVTGIGLANGGGGSNVVDVVNTGDDADINSTMDTTTNVLVNNNNLATVNQQMNAFANTGNNQANGNIGDTTSITTGNIGISGVFDVMANENITAISTGLNGGPMSHTMVTNTGNNALINTDTTNTTDVEVNNNNTADVFQLFNAEVNTGDNTADGNIGDGIAVSSGHAGILGMMSVLSNSNTTAIGGTGSSSSMNISDVVNTGDNINVQSNSTNTLSYLLMNSNTVSELQLVNSTTTTGNNSASGNIGSTLASSGTALAGADFVSSSNSNASVLGSISAALLALLASL
jgi:hypothetical protein